MVVAFIEGRERGGNGQTRTALKYGIEAPREIITRIPLSRLKPTSSSATTVEVIASVRTVVNKKVKKNRFLKLSSICGEVF